MRTLIGDARLLFRAMRHAPGFHALVTGILAFGIAAAVAVFSLVDGVLLRPLPYRDPGRLVALRAIATKPPFSANGSFPYADYEQFRKQAHSLAVEVSYRSGWSEVTLTQDGARERLRGAFVSPGFFALFGRDPIVGRVFTAEENQRRERVVVVGAGLAERLFGSASGALGKRLQLGKSEWRIVGVMPAAYRVPFPDSQFWAPVQSHPEWIDASEPDAQRLSDRWDLFGRLAPGTSLAAAQAEIDAIYAHLKQAAPDAHSDRALMVPLNRHFTGSVRRPFAILAAAVALLLLIAWANAGNLLLARNAGRRHEFAVRTALGAGAGRLLSQALAQTVTLCLVAGAIGSIVAAPLVRLLKAFAPAGTPRLEQVGVDGRILVFAASLSLLLGICLGFASMWRSGRRDTFQRLGSASRTATGGRESRRLKNALVVSEFALAMILLTGAALLVRSFAGVLAVDLGFRPERLLTLRVQLPADLPQAQQIGFYRDALAHIGQLPGVAAAGAANYVFTGVSRTHALRLVEGRPVEPVESWTALEWSQVTGDYFQAMGIPLVRGRFFDQRDGPAAPPVVIVNESAARRYWPGEDPVGKRVKGMDARGPNGGKNDDWVTVVGVVRDIHGGGREHAPFAQIYEPQAQRGEQTGMFVVRTAGDPHSIAPAARAAIRQTSPLADISQVSSMEQLLNDDEAERRFQTWLIGIFSALSLALAALGVFGVMHFSVTARIREIGIRVAVGATARSIVGLVLRDGAMLALAGIALGAIGSAWACDALAGMLFGVQATDPASFGAAALVLASAALAASYFPARRAARLDPLTALREQ